MKLVSKLTCIAIVALLATVIIKAGSVERIPEPPDSVSVEGHQEIRESVGRVNKWLRDHWAAHDVEPAETADDLTVFRRMTLALRGRIPSLEELTAFQEDRRPDRIERWLESILSGSEYGDYFGNRLVRMLTGIEEGLVFVFRRDRMKQWMSDSLVADKRWSEITSECIAGEGLWTNRPSANFLTAAYVDDEGFDVNALAGRTVRSFLGQRMDCAQCHDHFFAEWTQENFEGLAAFYGQTQLTFSGVVDRPELEGVPTEYRIVDVDMMDQLPENKEPTEPPGRVIPPGRVVLPEVPFHAEWMSQEGTRRQQLASWVVHPDNRRYERAIANRTWGLLFGRAWFDPVDDLPNPPTGSDSEDLLDVLGREFRLHDERLKAMIRIIVLSDAFRLQSAVVDADEEQYGRMETVWARFPLVRLRPEQMIGAMFQAGRVKTIDPNSNVFQRFARITSEADFLKEYGDETEDELIQQAGTIPQALLRMNGKVTRDLTKADLLTSVGQLVDYSPDNATLVKNCFLACLTRLPDADELECFEAMLQDREDEARRQHSKDDQKKKAVKQSRNQAAGDMYWVLFNSPGFSWNR